MNRVRILTLIAVAILAAQWSVVSAQIPQTISLQGVVRNADGTVLDQGQTHMRFLIYAVENGGSPVWSETKWVHVVQGVFGTQLGSDSALNVDFSQQYYVTYQVVGSPEFSPRIPFSSVPTSFRAEVADSLTGGVVRSINGSRGELHIKGVNGTQVTVLGDTITIDAASQGAGASFWERNGPVVSTTARVAIGTEEVPISGVAAHIKGSLLISESIEVANPPMSGRNMFYSALNSTLWIGRQSVDSVWSDTSYSHSTMLPGYNNSLHTGWSSILGGFNNEIDTYSTYTTIVQGYNNHIADSSGFSSILNGQNNNAEEMFATVVGGQLHDVSAEYATIVSGLFNTVRGEKSTIVGGNSQYISGENSFIGNGVDHYITGNSAGVVAGDSNTIRGDAGFIGGGENNEVDLIGFSSGILAGENNIVERPNSSIVAGEANAIIGLGGSSFIGAGKDNSLNGSSSFIGAGFLNSVSAVEGAVVAGRYNTVGSAGAGIVSGWGNGIGQLSGYSFIGAGYQDTIRGNSSGILAGMYNVVFGDYSSVVAGRSNSVTSDRSFIGAGTENDVTSDHSNILGGSDNVVSSNMSSILGGQNNEVTANYASIVGGANNSVVEEYGAILSGANNDVEGDFAVVLGGNYNTAVGDGSLAHGFRNTAGTAASDSANIALGLRNTTSARGASAIGFENEAHGRGSSAIGYQNEARGNYSFAAGIESQANASQTVAIGTRARAHHSGSVVICATNNTSAADTIGTANNAGIVMLAERGMFLTNQFGQATWDQTKLLNTSTGAYLSNGGTWTNSSDSTRKSNIKHIDNADILQKIRLLNISEWEYKDDEGRARHIGPMAQDFYAAFGLGHDATSISTIDPAGVALSGIQALADENEQLKERVHALEQLVNQLLEAQQ